MQRIVEPEWLDELPVDDPRAVHSRADLRRLNWLMDHAGIFARAFRSDRTPKRVMDVGFGDGAFALRMVKAAGWRGCEIVLVDRLAIISPGVRDGFAGLGCTVTELSCDVLQNLDVAGQADIIFTNLFLHHFQEAELKRLLHDLAGRCRVFAACEPWRAPLAMMASRLVGLIGCNAVTRHDAAASVRAGFCEQELSRLWPAGKRWSLRERPVGLFSHFFTARSL